MKRKSSRKNHAQSQSAASAFLQKVLADARSEEQYESQQIHAGNTTAGFETSGTFKNSAQYNVANNPVYGPTAPQTASGSYGPAFNNPNSQPVYNYPNYPQGTGYYQPEYYGQNYSTAHPNGYYQQPYTPSPQPGYPGMSYSQWNNPQYSNPQYNYQYPPGYDQYAQQHQQYQPTPPQIRNPFAPPPPARTQYTSQDPQHDPEYEAQLAQWQSAYAPQDPYEKGKKGGKDGKGENPNLTSIGVRQGPHQGGGGSGGDHRDLNVAGTTDEKKKTVVRKGGGETWEDDTLLEWDPTQFRIMVGNLAGEVTDDSLFKAFAQYDPSKARVVRDKRTTKSKGFGFVAFIDGELGFKAAREMTGKYIGSHPVTIARAKTDVRPVTKKDKNKHKDKNKDKGGKNDQLRANTGAHIEKKPVKNPSGYKILG